MTLNIFIRIILLSILTLIYSCGKEDEKEETKIVYDAELKQEIKCLRWVDRRMYFINDQTQIFQQLKIKSAIKEVERGTLLGENYFIFGSISEQVASNDFRANLNWNDDLSIVKLLNDADFDEYASTHYSSIPDNNVMVIRNPFYKRKYHIFFRNSCFISSTNCVDNDGNPLSDGERSALVKRAMGWLFQLNSSDDDDDIMNTVPSFDQDSIESNNKFYSEMNAQLRLIKNNANYYEDANVQDNCNNYDWMDHSIYMMTSTDDIVNNNEFHKNSYREAMDYIACNSMLDCNYFNYYETSTPLIVDIDKNVVDQRDISFALFLGQAAYNDLINNQLGITPPDNYSVTFINPADKSKFQSIFFTGCFESKSSCQYISELGLNALIARQLGLMVGMNFKDCYFYPNDVMCADYPKDQQWSAESQFIWFNAFNSALELIANTEGFYEPIKTTAE